MSDRLSSSSPVSISGRVIPSELQPGVTYRLERQIGEGGMGSAYLALRQAPDGLSPVVVKLVRPAFGQGSERAAALVVQKEAVALGRLNERVPPCPFVVRLVDTGAGANWQPRAGKLGENLSSAGIDPAHITKVVFTHAHPDHLWGVAEEGGALRFPNASYFVAEKEWNFWMAEDTVTVYRRYVPWRDETRPNAGG